MAYESPHTVRDYLRAACLGINHQFVIHCQRRGVDDKRQILIDLREIDLCAMLAGFFGRSGHLAAQGVASSAAADVEIYGPTIRCEVKYFRPVSGSGGASQSRPWAQLSRDWEWLTNPTNNGQEFKKRAWVVFWPSTRMFKFTQCLSVPKTQGTQYSSSDFAPFVPYAIPKMPTKGVNQRLQFRSPPDRDAIIQLPGGKRVRCELVGAPTHPLWAAVYTRLTPTDVAGLQELPLHRVDGVPITM